ncbi:MAG: glycoside hydrolase N-terminal domain-containing protein, partial [Clostridia bacterium]|nr:glycoside hydrolase N-terminal domain-containing protein [Clostridia bacterium]
STTTSNWNNVVVQDKLSTNNGYYPYGSGLADNGYYLFIGSGGNSSVASMLTLPETIKAGKYIKITYAKPKATNDGSRERSADNNDNTITVGSEVIDLKTNCEFDKWYTTTVKLDSDVSSISFALGKWSAVAISKIEVLNNADTMELTAEETEKYITPKNQTVQMSAKIYKSVTTLMGSNDIISKGSVDETAKVEYSINGYNGVSIDENGLLTITSAANAGVVKVTANYGGFEKTLNITLKSLGNATNVEIFGDEAINIGESKKYTAIPLIDGTVLPARDTNWEIVGEVEGVTVAEDGTLTATADAKEGIITLKATLTVSGVQTIEVSKEFMVTVRKETSSPYTVKGLLLTNGEADITTATGIDGVIIEKTEDTDKEYAVVVKVFDSSNKQIAENSTVLSGLVDGVQRVDLGMKFTKAAFAKVYVTEIIDQEYTEPVTVIASGNKITKTVIVNKENITSAVLIFAQYTDGELSSVDAKEVALQEGINSVDIEDVTLKENAELKVLLWDSLEGMNPVAEATTQTTEENSLGGIVVSEINVINNGEYTNVPLVADWITGAKSGLGMGAGIISPKGAPYGVDPESVDVSTLNVNYTYDANYPTPTTDNALWYKTGAYLASSSGANNSIYARDGADWEQKALPIGNGYMGGMLFGLPDKDQIQINEETFWAAGYRGTQTQVNSDTVNKNMSEGINGYMSVGNIFVDFDMPKGATVNNYYRDLNLEESVAHVQYEYDGVKYNREY